MNRISFIILTILGFFASSLQAQEKDNTPSFVNEFLNIGVGARAHGMFGSVVANVNDVTAAFWNPAGLTGINSELQVSAMHANWFGGISNYDHIAIGKSFNKEKRAAGSISIIRMGIDNIPNTLSLIGPDGTVNFDNVVSFSAADYAMLLSYGRGFGENLSFGGSIKVINRSIGDFATAWGFGLDIGAMYKKGNLSFGLMAKDITSTFNSWSFNFSEADKQVFQQTGNVIPVSSTEIALPRLILGASYMVKSNSTTVLFESNLNFSTNAQQAGLISSQSLSVDPTFGLEVGMSKKVFVRAGVGNIQRLLNVENTTDSRSLSFQPNVGLGVVLGKIKVDYALTNIGNASDALISHIFSLTLDISPRKREEQTQNSSL